MSTAEDARVAAGTVALAVAGFALALFGVYWDDAWHTDRGRDGLFSAPHLALYIGVMVAVAVVAWWGWLRRSEGWRRAFSGPVGMAVLGASVTLGSAPVDEWWHKSFGRDAVLWSPPHVVALVGTVALGTGVVLVSARSVVVARDRSGAALVAAAGAGVVGGWLVFVLEYDTDVAQFASLWYLPVLAAGLSAAALTVQVAFGTRMRWSAAWAGALYTVAMVAVIVGLWSMGFSTPIVPAIVPAMVAADVARRREWPVLERSAVFVVALFAVYLPYLRLVPGAVAPSLRDAALGLPLALVAVAVTVMAFDPVARWRRPTTRTTAVAAIALVALFVGLDSRPAVAHDPGQGVETTEIAVTADVTGQRIDVTAIPEQTGTQLEPLRVLARRAGRSIEGPLEADGGIWAGHVQVDEEGRWFVYIEASGGGDQLEAWLPVVIGADDTVSKRTALYIQAPSAATSPSQAIVGSVLLAVALLITASMAAKVRAASQRPAGTANQRA